MGLILPKQWCNLKKIKLIIHFENFPCLSLLRCKALMFARKGLFCIEMCLDALVMTCFECLNSSVCVCVCVCVSVCVNKYIYIYTHRFEDPVTRQERLKQTSEKLRLSKPWSTVDQPQQSNEWLPHLLFTHLSSSTQALIVTQLGHRLWRLRCWS